MSYIRSGTNPEGLYIWEGGNGKKAFVDISWPQEKPLSSGRGEIVIPASIFQKAVREWDRVGAVRGVAFKDFTIKEVYVNPTTGRDARRSVWKRRSLIVRDAEFFIRLGYKRKFVYLWQVTWEYVGKDALTQWSTR
ncbi:MAG: hypothetical protein A2Z21_01870 [Candidatus Fraserbacteria bacterium RBG_16_55_9]|uniref:Uncharacterized protein n=1 Tax=Fraserbacteria sp. (strain RBG_16_55_9) TaxID=1817864 RepID=A0A1F5UPA3_FRAXR|nr:MAG: hypothetical protein A2Z21_01870 [Candidatus Fraserbacteria bacterium RBG_16_55_9]